jgi:hypothetical protein
VSEKV